MAILDAVALIYGIAWLVVTEEYQTALSAVAVGTVIAFGIARLA